MYIYSGWDWIWFDMKWLPLMKYLYWGQEYIWFRFSFLNMTFTIIVIKKRKKECKNEGKTERETRIDSFFYYNRWRHEDFRHSITEPDVITALNEILSNSRYYDQILGKPYILYQYFPVTKKQLINTQWCGKAPKRDRDLKRLFIGSNFW